MTILLWSRPLILGALVLLAFVLLWTAATGRD
jgi:hypothetical protein